MNRFNYIRIRKSLVVLLLFFVVFIFDVSAQCSETANNGRLDPGEYCDPGGLRSGDEIFFDGIRTCGDIPSDDAIRWEGTLDCYPPGHEKECQLDISLCSKASIVLGGDLCPSCTSCDGGGNDCNANICMNFCAGGSGSCHYLGDELVRNDCESCQGVDSCEDYKHPTSCGSGGVDACNLASQDNWDGYFCDWFDGKCRTNFDCRWDCDGLYGSCKGDGFKYKSDGDRSNCELKIVEATDVADCSGRNPAVNFPDKVACGLYESNFPVFTWFNLALSIILLIGYYFVRKRF